MIIYNVTVKVDSDIADEWLEWMRTAHVPEVIATGCFEGYDILRLRFPKDEEGQTYAVQYRCSSLTELETYHRDHAASLQKDHIARYGNKALAFRTILETVPA